MRDSLHKRDEQHQISTSRKCKVGLQTRLSGSQAAMAAYLLVELRAEGHRDLIDVLCVEHPGKELRSSVNKSRVCRSVDIIRNMSLQPQKVSATTFVHLTMPLSDPMAIHAEFSLEARHFWTLPN